MNGAVRVVRVVCVLIYSKKKKKKEVIDNNMDEMMD